VAITLAAVILFPPLAVPLYLLLYPLLPFDAEVIAAPLLPAVLTGLLCLVKKWPRPRTVVLTVATAILSVGALFVAFLIFIATCDDCIT
jgi:hypothetical protein